MLKNHSEQQVEGVNFGNQLKTFSKYQDGVRFQKTDHFSIVLIWIVNNIWSSIDDVNSLNCRHFSHCGKEAMPYACFLKMHSQGGVQTCLRCNGN